MFAPNARGVQLCVNTARPGTPFTALFALEPCGSASEAKGCWQREVAGLPDSFEYVYRLDGGPELLDPYARCLTGGEVWGDRSWEALGLKSRPYRSLFVARAASAPGDGRPPRPRIAEGERVIYELHLRGFTRHPSSGVAHPGTYLGLIEKIPYLLALGVTTVELLPLLEFDETENVRRDPQTGERLLNFWGYSPISFFAPKAAYAADPTPGAAQGELMAMIDALHSAGLEVLVDVVYNHTAEGGGRASDPLHSFRGLAEDAYYLRDPATGRPVDVTGCGNTVNTNHPVVRRLILDSLRFWAEEIGVDGFRFDLAAAFYRGLSGEKLALSPIVAGIAADPVLAGRLLVAEPWDATGFTPPGGFPRPWREWNGAFRDDLRRYVRGDVVAARTLELRLGGSPDLFPPPHSRSAAVDFVTTVPGTQVDWGVDQDTWLRTLSVERAKFAGVARVLDPITHTVVRPLKVLVADEAKLVGALEEVRAAARARSRAAFLDPVPLIRSAYDAHLVGALVDYGDFDALARTLLRDPDAEVYRRLAT